jgi:hypothetical protein
MDLTNEHIENCRVQDAGTPVKDVLTLVLVFACFFLHQPISAQEIRTGLDYEYQAWERFELGSGLELRHQGSQTLKPDEILLNLSGKYKLSKHWKLGVQARWKSETDEDAERLTLMDDKNRYTMDVFYKTAVKNGWGVFQGRIRYQLSEEGGEVEDFYRLRLKWEHRTIRGLRPFASAEAILSELEPVPDACRFRTGLELDLGTRLNLGIFYQLEARLKEEIDILNYAVGIGLTICR